MKKSKILFLDKQVFMVMTAMLWGLFLTACGQEAVVQNDTEEISDFQFEVEDVYAISKDVYTLSGDGGVIVTGYVQRGTLKAGEKAVLIKEDGTKLEAYVEMLEVYDHEKDDTVFADEVGEDTPVGILLSGLEKEQVDIGDLLVNSGE